MKPADDLCSWCRSSKANGDDGLCGDCRSRAENLRLDAEHPELDDDAENDDAENDD